MYIRFEPSSRSEEGGSQVCGRRRKDRVWVGRERASGSVHIECLARGCPASTAHGWHGVACTRAHCISVRSGKRLLPAYSVRSEISHTLE